jgi:spermidine synthase
VDAVEIDPEVIDVASRYFNFSHDRLHIVDGRRFLREAGEPYDLVLIDAYGSSSIPFHLVTVEAFRDVRAALEPGGIVAINVISVGWNDPIVPMIGATLKEVFGFAQDRRPAPGGVLGCRLAVRPGVRGRARMGQCLRA